MQEAKDAQEVQEAGEQGMGRVERNEIGMRNTEIHYRLEIHKCFVYNDMSFRDCACHCRLENSKFCAIFGLG